MGNVRLISTLRLFIVFLQVFAYLNSWVLAVVTTDCVYDDTQALITYTGDPKAVVAVNKAGDECFFNENTATVTFTLLVKFSRTSDDDCVFDKSDGMELYTITVQGRKMIAEIQTDGDEEFLVECSFETYADDVEGATGVEDPVKSPVIISQSAGSLAISNFTVEVIKINGESFQNPYVRLGRLIKLKATMTGTANETRFHITNCKAFSTDMQSSAVLLTEGCGTGFPFAANQGFTLEGLSAISPSFRMFRVKRTQGVVFKCSFLICNEHCGPNSCKTSSSRRRKREALQPALDSDSAQSSDTLADQRSNPSEIVQIIDLQNITLRTILMGGESNKKLKDIHKIKGGYILDVENTDLVESNTKMKLLTVDQFDDKDGSSDVESYVRIDFTEDGGG